VHEVNQAVRAGQSQVVVSFCNSFHSDLGMDHLFLLAHLDP